MSVDVLAIGAHPDDVELGCAGTLAKLVAEGKSTAILHLTRGERGTRGTAPVREAEAREAARILAAQEVCFLDLGDGGLRVDFEAEDQLIEVFRRLRPSLVLGPPPADRHPDHARAHRLVRDAIFFSGLRKRGQGEPHRPGRFLSYMLHDPFPPTLVVDVTEHWRTKEQALASHKSQLFALTSANGAAEAVTGQKGPAARETEDPATWVSSEIFWRGIEGRARHYGMAIGCELGEPFWSPAPLPIADLMAIAESGP